MGNDKKQEQDTITNNKNRDIRQRVGERIREIPGHIAGDQLNLDHLGETGSDNNLQQ